MKLFYNEVDKVQLNKIISIDENSIQAEMTSNYSRCVKKTTDNKVFRKFTLVCVINNKKVIGYINFVFLLKLIILYYIS